jgi:superfamily I DNA and/or RNA helicase
VSLLVCSILQQYQTTLLKTEYRFNEDILDLINPHYDYKLKADNSIKDISTSDIAKKDYNGVNNNLTKILDHDKKIVFVDTNGLSQEQRTYINTGEISIVTQIIDGFMNMGIDDIIITTPYKQQERLFQLNHIKKSNYYNTRLRIGTIDEFQGQESEVTIVSMVRSNNNTDYGKAVGFVNIPRSCVAFSRSKRKTIIAGESKNTYKKQVLIKINRYYSQKRWVLYMEKLSYSLLVYTFDIDHAHTMVSKKYETITQTLVQGYEGFLSQREGSKFVNCTHT